MAGSPQSNGYTKATSAAVGRRAAPMMPKNERPHPRQAAAHAFLDFTYSRQASAEHFQQCAEFPTLVAALSASSRLLDLKSEAARFTKRNISATIVADGKRFFHQVNTDEVFGTHSPAICVHCARSALMSDLNLAVIGNSAIAALVDRLARIVWGWFPRFGRVSI